MHHYSPTSGSDRSNPVRLFCLAGGLLAVLLVIAATIRPNTSDAQAARLSDNARDGLEVGAVLHGYGGDWAQGNYRDVAANEFSAITSTIYFGWNGWLNPNAAPDTSGFDDVAEWSDDRNLLVHGHALVYPLATAASNWYNATDGSVDHEARMRDYVYTVAGSQAGKVWVWDVVNEVLADPGDSRRDQWGLRTDWTEYQQIGPDYVDKAFQWASDADPNALLIINDYGAEEINEKSDNLLAYAQELRRRGVPIDGVGFQMHWQGHRSEPNYASIRQNMARFADAGFSIFFTELDVMAKVANSPNEPPSDAELETQRSIYEEIARIATEQPAVESLLMWDYADDRSWLHPTIFDLGAVPQGVYTYPAPWTNGNPGSTMTKKPAYYGLVEGLSSGANVFDESPYRLTSLWEPATSYLQINPADGNAANLGSAGNNAAQEWVLEPAGDGFYRMHIDGSYLTRKGDPDGNGGYIPSADVEMQPRNTSWSSQLWRFESEPGGTYRIVNGWESATGLMTRFGTPAGDGFAPTSTVTLYSQNDWTSQSWRLEPVGTSSSTAEMSIGLASFPSDGGFVADLSTESPYQTTAWREIPWGDYNAANGETRPARCDVDDNGQSDLVIGLGSYTASGGWLPISLDSGEWRWVRVPWSGYNADNGETFVACGNLDADSAPEIVVGLGAGGQGWAYIFDDASTDFQAHPNTPGGTGWINLGWGGYDGGVHPAIGDLDGDGSSEIALATGAGGRRWVRVFDSSSGVFAPRADSSWIQAGSTGSIAEADHQVWPAICDQQLVLGASSATGTGGGGWLSVREIGSSTIDWFQIPWSTYSAAVGATFPACGDLDGDGTDNVAVGMGPYPEAGGYVALFAELPTNDGADGSVSWPRLSWDAYIAASGETRPAID